MSTGTIPSCRLGLTVETLSAWRDESLTSAEMERVAGHLATCPACRDRLAQYDAIAGELRTQPVPAPDERLWAAVHAGMAGARSPRTAAERRRQRATRVWKGLAAVAAILVLVAGFGQVLRSMTSGRGTAPATRTPIVSGPIPPLHWQLETFPAGFELTQPISPSAPTGQVTRTISVSQADGNTAYACAAPQPGQGSRAPVWVTHDRAAHWTRVTDVPGEGTADICGVEADAHDPRVVLVELAYKGSARDEWWASFDGGQSWKRLPETAYMHQLTTVGDMSYAVRMPNSGPHSRLMASTDHMQTWTAIDADIIAAGYWPFGLWVNPTTGELLARAERPPRPLAASAPTTLWDSRDGGRHWRQLPLPSMEADLAVDQPEPGKSWNICAADGNAAATQPPTHGILCSTDDGQTWVAEPQLVPSSSAAGPIRLVGIGSDGALLAISPIWDATHQRIAGFDLYRLAPGARQWQALGPVPEPQVAYAPVAGGGLLWSFSSPQMLAPDAVGNLISPTSSGLYVAAYP